MDKFSIFEDLSLGKLRVIVKDGEPWFVLLDVCRILGNSSNSAAADAANRLEPCEKAMDIVHTLGGDQEMVTVSEGGLYYLICTSRKPSAKAFRLWVTGTVLVSIRKNNGYVLGQEDMPQGERKTVEDAVKKLSPVKKNPLDFSKQYVAKDGHIFYSREECIAYNRELWN